MDFRLLIEPGELGMFYGTSPDVPELFVATDSAEKIIPTAVEVVSFVRNLRLERSEGQPRS